MEAVEDGVAPRQSVGWFQVASWRQGKLCRYQALTLNTWESTINLDGLVSLSLHFFLANESKTTMFIFSLRLILK